MIELLPSILNRSDVDSPGELDLYNIFKKFQQDKDWIIYHSLEITKHIRQKNGQADFVIIIPNRGVIIVEVKHSINVERREGIWYLSGLDPSSKSPWSQAKENSESLRRIASRNWPNCKNILFTHLVVFTRSEFNQSSPSEWERWQFINAKQLDSAKDNKLEFFKLFENVITKALETGSLRHSIGLNTPDIHQLPYLKKLRKNFSPILSPKEREEKLQHSLLKTFTENQLDTLDKISGNKKIIIMGPAGTGKTLLAIESARRNVSKKIKTLFLCKNKKIHDYIKSQITPVIGEFLNFSTIDKFLLTETGNKVPNFDKENFFRKLPHMLLDKLMDDSSNNQEHYDCLIIDEAQIILTQEYIDIFDLIIKGGLKNGSYIFFGDFYGQALAYNFDYSQLEVEEFIDSYRFMRYSIYENCRNTEFIANFSSLVCNTNPYNKIFRLDSPSEHNIGIKYKNNYEQLTELAKLLNKLSDEKIENNQIIILTIKNEFSSCVNEIQSLSSYIKGYNDKTKHILLPYATAVWLIEETKLTFRQISKFCNLDLMIIQQIEDENIAKNIKGLDPVKYQQLTLEEIDRCSNDDTLELNYKTDSNSRFFNKDMIEVLNKVNKPNGIEFSTCRKFIGMEKSIVILCDVDDISDPVSKSLMHIGITRTLDRLYVLSNNAVSLVS